MRKQLREKEAKAPKQEWGLEESRSENGKLRTPPSVFRQNKNFLITAKVK